MSAKPLVSVLTPTVPGREHYLKEACHSVKAQTLKGVEHLVRLDSAGEGCSKTVNKLAAEARADRLLILADDDILLPRCLELLVEAWPDVGPIVYPVPMVWGEGAGTFLGDPPHIPSLALIPTRIWRQLGGYNESLSQVEDGDFFYRAMQADTVFIRFDQEPTWIYRFWTAEDGTRGNKSRR